MGLRRARSDRPQRRREAARWQSNLRRSSNASIDWRLTNGRRDGRDFHWLVRRRDVWHAHALVDAATQRFEKSVSLPRMTSPTREVASPNRR